jgi:hypothetical protein
MDYKIGHFRNSVYREVGDMGRWIMYSYLANFTYYQDHFNHTLLSVVTR